MQPGGCFFLPRYHCLYPPEWKFREGRDLRGLVSYLPRARRSAWPTQGLQSVSLELADGQIPLSVCNQVSKGKALRAPSPEVVRIHLLILGHTGICWVGG